MQFSTLSALAATLLASSALAAGPLAARQGGDANGLLEALRGANLTSLADVLANNTAIADALFADDSRKFILAPNNEAIAGLPTWVTSNSTILQATLLQHVLRGEFNADDFNSFPLHTIGHSFLTSSDFVNLPGGAGQAVAFAKSGGSFVSEAVNNDTFVGSQATYQGITVQPISKAIAVPGNLTSTLKYLGYDALLQQISSVNNGALAAQLDGLKGITVFAPTDAAIQAFAATNPNPAELPAVLGQHVIQSRVVYSPLLIDQGALVTSSGQDLTYDNDAGTVTVDGKSAKIVQTDIICGSGVIHRIDTVLASNKTDEARAAQAQKSAEASVDENKAKALSGPVTGTNAISSQGTDVPKAQDGSDANRSADANTSNAGTGQSSTGIKFDSASSTAGANGSNGTNGTNGSGSGTNGSGNGSNGSNSSNGNAGNENSAASLTAGLFSLGLSAIVASVLAL